MDSKTEEERRHSLNSNLKENEIKELVNLNLRNSKNLQNREKLNGSINVSSLKNRQEKVKQLTNSTNLDKNGYEKEMMDIFTVLANEYSNFNSMEAIRSHQ